jgi:WD40 repeat protein
MRCDVFGPVSMLPGRRPLAVDPSGTLVATGAFDGTVRIGPIAGGEPHVFLGHRSYVRALAFSADGRWLASGGGDQTIRLWRVPDLSGTPLHKRPLAEFLAVLHSHTNLRAVTDPQAANGWKLEAGPFPGWAKLPEW